MSSVNAIHQDFDSFDKELEMFDNTNQINYLALYLSIISPLPISVEKSFDIILGKEVLPTEKLVTSKYLEKIKRYFEIAPTKNIEKAEKVLGVNRYKLKAYLKGALKPIDSQTQSVHTLSDFYKTL